MIEDRLYDAVHIPIMRNSHASIREGACVMELVGYVAGEPWSDRPPCACPVIGCFLRCWNDALPDAVRDTLLRPVIPRLVGTKGSPALERRRALMALDWSVRVQTPAWLRLVGLTVQADAVATLPEITDMARCPSFMPTLEAVRSDVRTLRDAGGATAWNAASGAVWDAVWYAAGAAEDTAGNAAGDIARDVAMDIARGAAEVALDATRRELQASALALIDRMIEAGELGDEAA